jgi:hypothetical protein
MLEEGEGWVLGARQPTFAHELQIGPAEPWSRDDPDGLARGALATVAVEGSEWDAGLPDAATVWELTVRMATVENLPAEHGSEGYREAVLRPLVHVVDGRGLPVACPVFEIDRLRGDGAGGRWVLAPSDAALDAPIIRALVERALEGAVQLDARPVFASVEPGEPPRVRVVQRRPFPRAGEAVPSRAEVVVTAADGGREVFRAAVELAGQPESRHGEVAIAPPKPLAWRASRRPSSWWWGCS